MFDEPGAGHVDAVLDQAAMSAVNIAEVAAVLHARAFSPADIRATIRRYALAIFPADEELAIEAGLLRRITGVAGLSLGDRCCLALGGRLNCPVLTADRAWMNVADAAGVQVRLIR